MIILAIYFFNRIKQMWLSDLYSQQRNTSSKYREESRKAGDNENQNHKLFKQKYTQLCNKVNVECFIVEKIQINGMGNSRVRAPSLY